ncbi:MAG: glycosyltransferase, partial [Bdellovibrionota bacterium]
MSPKTNILYLVPSTGFGGAETFLVHTAKFHDEEKINATYLCFREGPLTAILRSCGKEVIVLPEAPRLRNPLSVLRAILQIARAIKNQRAHLIHSTMAYGAIFGSIASVLSHVPHVWFQHGPVTGWIDRLASWLPARLIFVNSEFTSQEQRKLGPFHPHQLITLGVDVAKAQASLGTSASRLNRRSAWESAEGDFIIGVACRPQRQKGLELLIEAIKILNESNPEILAKMIIIGSSSAEHSGLSAYEKEISACAAEKKVPLIFSPAAENIFSEIGALDILVSTSVSPEAFGLTLIEAMAVGTPVIAPREGGPLDIIREGKNGFFFAPRNPADLARKIQLVYNLSAEEKNILRKAE